MFLKWFKYGECVKINLNYQRQKRIDEIISLVKNDDFNKLTISIKTPNPIDGTTWGDYYFSLALAKEFKNIQPIFI